jgi:hypothetical protein
MRKSRHFLDIIAAGADVTLTAAGLDRIRLSQARRAAAETSGCEEIWLTATQYRVSCGSGPSAMMMWGGLNQKRPSALAGENNQ